MLESNFTNENYFSQFTTDRDKLLLQLEEEARKDNISIIGPVMGQLLSLLIVASNAKQILELGTAIGYSTLFMARALPHSQGSITTIERSEERANRARDNFRNSGFEDIITVMTGDALEVMINLDQQFDFLFMDIDKSTYLPALEICSTLLKRGGLLIADNTSFTGADDFNKKIHDSDIWRAVQLYSFLPSHSPEHDGICFAIRV